MLLTAAIRIQHVSAIESALKQHAGSSHATEPGPVPGHYLTLCFPKSTRQTFSLSPIFPAAPGDAHVRAGGTAGLGIPARALLGAAVARPTAPTQEEGRSITLGMEIPPLQLEGFTPRFTEVSMVSVICFCKYVYGGFLHSTNPVRTSNNPQSQLIK